MNDAPPPTTPNDEDAYWDRVEAEDDARIAAMTGGRTPAQNRAWIEAYTAEAARLRALGSHDDIEVTPEGDVFRLLPNGRREVIEFAPPKPGESIGWHDPMAMRCGGVR